MSPNDIKRIVNAVVDYGTSWQIWDPVVGAWIGPITQSLPQLLHELARGTTIQLAPKSSWDWPMETRDGMACWYRCLFTLNPEAEPSPWSRRYISPFAVNNSDYLYQEVAPDPINPTMEPPLDWSPENKRILK
jgi:hypothetical protein